MIYGPFSHTFRAYRLQALLQIPKDVENDKTEIISPNKLNTESPQQREVHFYGWECISLKLHNRTFDLVIKNERDRTAFI